MTRDSLLMCEGKARKVGSGEKELTDRGKRFAQKTGVWLLEHALRPGVVSSSPDGRARTTAEKLLKAAGWSARDIVLDERLSAPEAEKTLAVLAALPETSQPTLVVCKKDGVARLLQHLLGSVPTKLMPGMLLWLKTPEDWSNLPANSAELLQVVRPRDLPNGFPYPGIGGTERRQRPAYYYSQSAVIPYRLGPDGLEVLLIGSSKGTHWGIPKGIHEPGLSATESASHEALEEAGVRGVVHPSCIGAFHLSKWGALCRVDVFPMEVTQEIGLDDWQESHRSRRWLGVKDAVGLLFDNPELSAIVAELPDWHDSTQP